MILFEICRIYKTSQILEIWLVQMPNANYMHSPDRFNLTEALEVYLCQIDRQGLLSGDEREEITDHLLTEMEMLQENDLSEREAFTLATRQFGPSELISLEYQRVKPQYNIRKAIIAAALFLFLFVFLAGSLYALSSVVWKLSREFALSTTAEKYLDIGLKVIFIFGSIAYLWWRFNRRSTPKTWEMILIPILGLTAPFFNNILNYFLSNTGHISYSTLLSGHWNSYIILSILLAGILIVCYRLVLKWHNSRIHHLSATSADSKAMIGILVAFFLTLASFVVVTSLISCFTFWLSTVEYYGIGWVRWFDLVLKFLFLGGILAVITSRIQKQIYFKKLELFLIPVIGFASPYLSDLLFLSLFPRDHWNHSTRKMLELFNYNSQIIIITTIIIIALTTYSLMYKEQKLIRISG